MADGRPWVAIKTRSRFGLHRRTLASSSLSSDMRPTAPSSGGPGKKKRTTYDHAFKLKVVRAALERPPNNRIKPTCAWFPGIEPCQADTATH